jgi:hypothetical protein
MNSVPSGLVRLPTEAVLCFKGTDAKQFLQGQTSADFVKSAAHTPIRGVFCNVKGRVIADFTAILRDEHTVLMKVSQTLAQALAEHLKKYLMFSKTQLTIDEFGVFIHPEPQTTASGASLLSPIDAPDGYGVQLIAEDGQSEYWLTGYSATDTASAEYSAWWARREIELGTARVTGATSEIYLPQELNYDLLGYVNFKKGCYTGQEVVARLHYRGKPKRRLYLARSTESNGPLAAGDSLLDAATEQTQGTIVNTATSPEGGSIALVSVAHDYVGGTLQDASRHQLSIDEHPAITYPH